MTRDQRDRLDSLANDAWQSLYAVAVQHGHAPRDAAGLATLATVAIRTHLSAVIEAVGAAG